MSAAQPPPGGAGGVFSRIAGSTRVINSEIQQRDQMRAAAEMLASRLDAFNIPEASELAGQLRENPLAAGTMMKSLGGAEQVLAGFQLLSQRQRAGEALAVAGSNLPPGERLDRQSVIDALTPIVGLEAATKFANERAKDPRLEPVDTSKVTPESLADFEQSGRLSDLRTTTTVGPGANLVDLQGRSIFSSPFKELPEGGVEIDLGGMGKISLNMKEPLRPNVVGQFQKDLAATQANFERTLSIQDLWNPKFQEIGPRLGFASLNFLDKLPGDLPEWAEQELAAYDRFRRRAFEQINLYIKQITGAQMSVKEFQRLQRAMPDPGTGVTDGDGPTRFKAKLDDVTRMMALQQARAHWALQNNLGPVVFGGTQEVEMPDGTVKEVPTQTVMSMGDMEAIINRAATDRFNEITATRTDLTREQQVEMTKDYLTATFNIPKQGIDAIIAGHRPQQDL